MIKSIAVATPFELLGVQPDAEPEVVEAAYRALMKKHHPDRTGGDAAKAQQINAAYAAIRGDTSRPRNPAVDETADRYDPPNVQLTPPFRAGRALGMTVLVSAAVITLMGKVVGLW